MEEAAFYGRELGVEGGGYEGGYEVGAPRVGGEGEGVLGVGVWHFCGRREEGLEAGGG